MDFGPWQMRGAPLGRSKSVVVCMYTLLAAPSEILLRTIYDSLALVEELGQHFSNDEL
jgi:hypothetical protein